jgi:lipopolysaccharide/colanic/teichoic acid biosynthesis glycosyltransferase
VESANAHTDAKSAGAALNAGRMYADFFIEGFADLEAKDTFRFDSSSPGNLRFIPEGKASVIINYRRVNDIRFLNKFFEKVNHHLYDGGLFIGCVETKASRKKRVLSKLPKPLNYGLYLADFFYKRVLPKLPGIRKAYFAITKGNNRVLTFTECKGRLISCGFRVEAQQKIGYYTWFVARKKGEPVFDMNPTYGAIVKLKRIGKDGNLINIYKLRTMHPYSEYIQKDIFETNQLKKGGKINSDFRITNWGKLLRRFWIDEIPMLWNWLRGDVKLIGVRPLSRHYFSLYPEELQRLRIKHKPGLIPPFYADMPETLEEITASERAYLLAYEKAPLRTDLRYFSRSIYNILFRSARSS